MSEMTKKKYKPVITTETVNHITKVVNEHKFGEHLDYERCRGDQVTRINAVGEDGTILAHLWPDKRFSSKKIKAISIMYYDKQSRRCTRFLASPKNVLKARGLK